MTLNTLNNVACSWTEDWKYRLNAQCMDQKEIIKNIWKMLEVFCTWTNNYTKYCIVLYCTLNIVLYCSLNIVFSVNNYLELHNVVIIQCTFFLANRG